MSLTEFNAMLRDRSYVEGGTDPSSSDALEFKALFGDNKNVMRWVARMAQMYAVERNELSLKKPVAEKKAEKKPTEDVSDKKLKAVKKEGGKKAQDLAGMAEMGSSFQQATLVEPEGRMDLLEVALEAMNAPVEPDCEERKGGAGGVAKILLSATDHAFSCIIHVPQEYTHPANAELNPRGYSILATDWAEAAFSTLPGDGKGVKYLLQTPTLVKATYKPQPDLGRYTLKAKDAVSGASFAFLRERNLVVDNDSSDDEYIFGDDDMPGI
eukprot:TRINITY_DN12077_c0_g1_i1.p1 TRINITY_DN12077_c0_g1~~TRINITY_DN12077_c0_g1_i1.p1  ORF type:complete len:269 (+),score=91.79 TRINITY_DN12077_c0_g1_i1:117-923(+)